MTVWLAEPPTASAAQIYVHFANGTGTGAGLSIFDGNLAVEIYDGDRFDRTSFDFDPAQHVFLRVTTSSIDDALTVSTSADGITYVDAGSLSGLPDYLDGAVASIGAGVFEGGAADSMSFGRIDVAPAGCR
jgi:hypothetical protein